MVALFLIFFTLTTEGSVNGIITNFTYEPSNPTVGESNTVTIRFMLANETNASLISLFFPSHQFNISDASLGNVTGIMGNISLSIDPSWQINVSFPIQSIQPNTPISIELNDIVNPQTASAYAVYMAIGNTSGNITTWIDEGESAPFEILPARIVTMHFTNSTPLTQPAGGYFILTVHGLDQYGNENYSGYSWNSSNESVAILVNETNINTWNISAQQSGTANISARSIQDPSLQVFIEVIVEDSPAPPECGGFGHGYCGTNCEALTFQLTKNIIRPIIDGDHFIIGDSIGLTAGNFSVGGFSSPIVEFMTRVDEGGQPLDVVLFNETTCLYENVGNVPVTYTFNYNESTEIFATEIEPSGIAIIFPEKITNESPGNASWQKDYSLIVLYDTILDQFVNHLGSNKFDKVGYGDNSSYHFANALSGYVTPRGTLIRGMGPNYFQFFFSSVLSPPTPVINPDFHMDVGQYSATIRFEVYPYSTFILELGWTQHTVKSTIRYGLTTNYTWEQPGTGGGLNTVTLSNLTPNTTYHYQIASCSTDDLIKITFCSETEDLQFTTLEVPPPTLAVRDQRMDELPEPVATLQVTITPQAERTETIENKISRIPTQISDIQKNNIEVETRVGLLEQTVVGIQEVISDIQQQLAALVASVTNLITSQQVINSIDRRGR